MTTDLGDGGLLLICLLLAYLIMRAIFLGDDDTGEF